MIVTAAVTAGVVRELTTTPYESPTVTSWSPATDGGPAPVVVPVDGTPAAAPDRSGCTGGYVTTQDAGAGAPLVRPRT